MKRRIVNERIAKLMTPEERKKHGIETAAETIARAIAKSEKAEHDIYLNWCRVHGFPVHHDRTDKATTGNVGWPDFLFIYCGRVLPIEMKLHGNKLSPAQKLVLEQFEAAGTDVLVCANADEAIRKTKAWLWENFKWQPPSA
jgi:hypothetical protein